MDAYGPTANPLAHAQSSQCVSYPVPAFRAADNLVHIHPEISIWLDHVLLKAVARDKRQRIETADEFSLALARVASSPRQIYRYCYLF